MAVNDQRFLWRIPAHSARARGSSTCRALGHITGNLGMALAKKFIVWPKCCLLRKAMGSWKWGLRLSYLLSDFVYRRQLPLHLLRQVRTVDLLQGSTRGGFWCLLYHSNVRELETQRGLIRTRHRWICVPNTGFRCKVIKDGLGPSGAQREWLKKKKTRVTLKYSFQTNISSHQGLFLFKVSGNLEMFPRSGKKWQKVAWVKLLGGGRTAWSDVLPGLGALVLGGWCPAHVLRTGSTLSPRGCQAC